MKCFSTGCRILFLLLSFILTLQEVYSDGTDNATSTDAASQGQSNSGKTGPISLIVDKFSNLVKSLENLPLFKSKKYEHPQYQKAILASYLYDDKELEEANLKKHPVNQGKTENKDNFFLRH